MKFIYFNKGYNPCGINITAGALTYITFKSASKGKSKGHL